MSALVQNLGDFLKVVIQAFNLSSTFPALILVGLLQFLPEGSITRLDAISDVGVRNLVMFVSVAVIAYLLDAVNIVLIRFLEGYWLKTWMPQNPLQKANESFVQDTFHSIRKYEKLANDLMDKVNRGGSPELLSVAEEAIMRKLQLMKQLAPLYPEDPAFVLPTPFGNVIAAAEQYPKKVFNMDAIVLWPFIIPTLTEKNYAQYLMRERSIMDFLLNITAVLSAFGFALLLAEWSIVGWSMLLAIKLGVVAVSCIISYALSIQAAASWGAVLRAAFVLYREDLRQALRLRQAKDYRDERNLWEAASNFFRARSTSENQLAWGLEIFDSSSYISPKPDKEKK